MKQELKPEQKAFAIETLKQVLWFLNRKKFGKVPEAVDGSEIENLPGFLREFVQGTLELNDRKRIDVYGAPCNFHPQYEYHQLHFYDCFDEKGNITGFSIDYQMTAGGELCNLVLQLAFLYQPDGSLKRIFQNVDPM